MLMCCLLCSLVHMVWAGEATAQSTAAKIDFTRDVQPIFAKHCYTCHGERKQKAGLRLDRRPDALLSKLFVVGKSAESRLIRLVSGTDPENRMPPDGQMLLAKDIETLRAWIDQGAKWPAPEGDHWSLRRLSLPAIPATKDVQHPIDAFIRTKLSEKGLSHSAPADRRTLIRRLTFNLHGLPPTPAEIESFVRDDSPKAYEQLVERLLASPRYGERWARHWMDIAHFAETHGHDQDVIRENAWPYRDYLIRAFNADLPYARFVQDQIAGDVLNSGDASAIAALGFLAAGPWDESSQSSIRDDTIDKKQAQYIDRDDMITTVFTAIASTSIHCARCHDHKFDPISQKEYYGLQAVFAGVERANRSYEADPALAKIRGELLAKKADILAGKFDLAAERAKLDEWEKQIAGRLTRWKTLNVVVSAKDSKIEPQTDGSFRFAGKRPDKDVYSFKATTGRIVTAIRLEVLSDPSLPMGGPGRQDNGNLHLSEIRVKLSDGTIIPITSAAADFNQDGWGIARAIDGNPATAWGIHPAVGKMHEAVFILKQPIPANATFTVELDQLHGAGHLIGRARLSVSSDANPAVSVNPLPTEVVEILAIAPEKRNEAQSKTLIQHRLLIDVEARLAVLPIPQMVYAAASDFATIGSFKAPKGPRVVHMLIRGDITKPGETANAGTIACVQGPGPLIIANPTDEGQRRAAIARWLTDRENGLVWRSIVNRVWHHHFGRGIMNTPNDFGRMGATPTHPELLDWLAVWFRDRGGSLKDLHRLIVTSETYRQSSAHNADYTKIDSDNAYLWRMNRTRLDAESVRDAVLAASGKLDSTMHGPSSRQFALSPGIHVTPKVEYEKFDFDSPASRRRSVYRFVFRTLPDPFYEALDCPDASQFTPVRASSVTALQALAMMNDRFTVRYAEHFAKRVEATSQDCLRQIGFAYEEALGRSPTELETKRLADFAERHGLANACRLLFNCNEFLFVD